MKSTLRYLLDYRSFSSKLNEQIEVFNSDILDILQAERADIKVDLNNTTLDKLSERTDFNEFLERNHLYKGNILNTADYMTFMAKDMKFMFLHKDNEFQANYVLIENGGSVSFYKVKNDDLTDFYNKLSSKTVEVKYEGQDYIYTTSSVNTWLLKNVEAENALMKKEMTREELSELIRSKNLKYKLIGK